MLVSPEQIRKWLKELDFLCIGCGSNLLEKGFDIDHKKPRSRGGSDDISNLHLLCQSCNRSKGARTIEEWAPWLLDKTGNIIKPRNTINGIVRVIRVPTNRSLTKIKDKPPKNDAADVFLSEVNRMRKELKRKRREGDRLLGDVGLSHPAANARVVP